MPRLLTILILCCMAPMMLRAQHEYDQWFFGTSAGIDFRGGSARAIQGGMIRTAEGNAGICDRATGKLLFYTDGVTVWNGEHAIMRGGTGLAGHYSAAQGAVIVPVPCSATLYYIFTTDSEPNLDPPNNGMHYSIVDMEKDGGRGEVVTKNVLLLPTASERMTAARHANGTDYWVIAHSLGGDTFHAFHLTAGGSMATPVDSRVGLSQGDPDASGVWTMGMMKMSPDGRRLAHTVRHLDLIELFDFDAATGVVSNAMRIPPVEDFPWGLSFSPDNSRLYVTGDFSRLLLQYTLSPYDPAAIAASRTVLGEVGNGSDLQIGPDKAIHVARLDQSRMGIIARPNEQGVAAGYSENGVDLLPGRSRWALPNNLPGGLQSLDACDLVAMVEASEPGLCSSGCVEVVDRSVGSVHSWEWSFPGGTPSSFAGRTPPPICYSSPGRYPIIMIVQGATKRDTAVTEIVVAPVPTIDAGPDVRLCTDSSAILAPGFAASAGARFSWSPAAGLSCVDCSSPVASPLVGTDYRMVMTTAEGCVAVDSVRVDVGQATVRLSIGRDHAGEPGDTLLLPVMLTAPLDPAGIVRLDMTLRYDSTFMRMIPAPLRADSMRMEGWEIIVVDQGLGYLRIECRAPAGETLRGRGTLFALPAVLFLGKTDSSEIAIDVDPVSDLCTELVSSPGLVRVVGCMIDTRLIELFDAKNALAPPGPSPFRESVEIRFSRALPGATRVVVSDAAGREVALLFEGAVEEGWQRVIWDATGFAAGRYFVTVVSGEWRETTMVVKVE